MRTTLKIHYHMVDFQGIINSFDFISPINSFGESGKTLSKNLGVIWKITKR